MFPFTGIIRTAGWSKAGLGDNRFVCAMWLMQAALLLAKARGTPLPDLELVMQSTDGAQSTTSEGLKWQDPAPLFGSIKCGPSESVTSTLRNLCFS